MFHLGWQSLSLPFVRGHDSEASEGLQVDHRKRERSCSFSSLTTDLRIQFVNRSYFLQLSMTVTPKKRETEFKIEFGGRQVLPQEHTREC